MTREPYAMPSAASDPWALLKEARAEIEQLKAEKSEMADAILQIAGSSEMHFRTLVSFELAEFVFTERVAAALDRKP